VVVVIISTGVNTINFTGSVADDGSGSVSVSSTSAFTHRFREYYFSFRKSRDRINNLI
tara:strand:- start:2899 stop:3072 length:174 start_codon:yes stop_codon:yes gene_type:complete